MALEFGKWFIFGTYDLAIYKIRAAETPKYVNVFVSLGM